MEKFKFGDKVVCIDSCQSFPKLVYGKTYNVVQQDDKFVKLLEHSVSFLASRFKLVDTMDHLYDNEKPFGLLSKEEQNHLVKKEKLSLKFYDSKGVWKDKVGPVLSLNVVYRPKRPPERVSITSLTGTVEMKDGKPDWTTYKE